MSDMEYAKSLLDNKELLDELTEKVNKVIVSASEIYRDMKAVKDCVHKVTGDLKFAFDNVHDPMMASSFLIRAIEDNESIEKALVAIIDRMGMERIGEVQ